jgi:hypothetical protein
MTNKYFDKDDIIKKYICYDLALEIDECECPNSDCHCDLSKDRYYDSVYDPLHNLTMCGPCAYSECYLEKQHFNLREYCINSDITDSKNKLCPRCIANNHCTSNTPVCFWEIDQANSDDPKKLEECVLCKNYEASLYFCPEYFDKYIDESFQICLKCLQIKENIICQKLDLIFRINQYIANLDEDINECEVQQILLNKEEYLEIIEKYKNDKKLSEYLAYFNKKNDLPSVKSAKKLLTEYKNDREKLNNYLIHHVINNN